jgi:N-succinyldiaminopimelate aminotransferase
MDEHGGWQRTAAGAGLLSTDGSIAATIFAEMSALATQTGAINLGQGFPDEDGPAEVLAAATEAIRNGTNQYPPGRGIPDLRLAISEHQKRFYGLTVDPDTEVLVTAGATEGLAAGILALVEPGDEVLTFEPFYDAYGGLIGLAGAEHRTVQLRWPDFQPDHDDLRRAVSDRTRIILVNNPHNPTGAVFDRATLDLIVELADRHDAIIVTDEVYEHLVYGTTHIPVASLPGAWERTLTLSSGGKTFNTTGWKIGWATGPADLVTAVTTVKQYLTYVNGAPFQPAIAAGLRLPDAFFSGIALDLQAKRDILADGLSAAGFSLSLPAGSYFIVADASALEVTDAAEFCRELPTLAGVVGIPITAFVRNAHQEEYRSLVRFAFCKKRSVLQDAAARLASLGN